MEIVYNNYLRSSGSGPTWNVEIDPPSRPVGTYFEETIRAAEMIWSQKQGDLYLCYSGGLDSEFALSVLRHLGMTVTPVIMCTQYNQIERQYAFDYCDAHNIKPVVINLDLDEFINSGEMLEIAKSIQCGAWQIASNMWLTSQLDGTVITGECPPHLKKVENIWYHDEDQIYHSTVTYFKNNGIYGTPFFMNYTAEMVYAFLTDPTITNLANNRIYGKLGSHSSKVHVYNNNGNSFVLENRTKLHGYETVKDSPIFQHKDISFLTGMQSEWWGLSDTEYHSMIDTLKSGQIVRKKC
jgi:hypothetical protein